MVRLACALAVPAIVLAAAVGRTQPASEPPTDPQQPASASDQAEAAAPAPAAAPAEPTSEGQPPPGYYTDPPAAAGEPAGAAQPAPQQAPAPGVYEPPPPGAYPALIHEPPPPPKPRHVAPKTAFWAGARLGWLVPFGSLWADCTAPDLYGNCYAARAVPFREYTSAGPLFELDIGVRLGRRYNLLFLWEHTELGGGDDNPRELPVPPPSPAGPDRGDTDYYAFGVRFSSDPDDLGFLTELALGYRRMRVQWEDGTELQLTDAPFEFRLGMGADIRFNPYFSLTPLATIGFGSFGSAEWVHNDGTAEDATDREDMSDAHGWFTLQVGGHIDLGK